MGGVDVGVTAPRGLDPDDDLALTSDRLGNLLDDERPRKSSTTPAPHRLRRSRSSRPLLLNDAIGALLRLHASVPEVRHTDIGLSTDPMRSITDSGTVDRSSGRVSALLPIQAARPAKVRYADDQQSGFALVGVTGDQVGEGLL